MASSSSRASPPPPFGASSSSSSAGGDKADLKTGHKLDPVASRTTGDIEALDEGTGEQDAVFGNVDEGGPNFRNLGWKGTTGLMMKTQIGIGVLSIPKTFHSFGLIPGLIILLTVAAITTWSDYMVGLFKLRHREIYGLDDAGYVMFGRLGREVFGAAFCIYFTFVSASAILGVSISLNALSEHGACTAVFVAVAAVVAFCFSSIRELSKISWIAYVGVASVIISILVLTVAMGVQDRPAEAPQNGEPFVSDYKLVAHPSVPEAFSGVATIIFAFSGTPAFFPIIAEMREPEYFRRAVLIAQSVVTVIYSVIGIVVYYYAGSYVASPALGSAGALMKKVTYGIALPGLIVTTLIMSHMPAKYFFVRIARGTRHMTSNTWQHWTLWLSCNAGVVIVAYIIASAIPSFDALVAFIGALLATLMCFAPMGCMWLYDNYTEGKKNKTLYWKFMVGWCVFVISSGTFCMVAGSYGAIIGIIDEYSGNDSTAWSCADNSNST